MYGDHRGGVRIAIVTESYGLDAAPVSSSMRRVVVELAAMGHDAIVIAPGRGPTSSAGFPVVRVAAVSTPWLYGSRRVGLPVVRRIESILREFGPDVVLLADPVVLGAAAAVSARRAGLPMVSAVTRDPRCGERTAHNWRDRARRQWLCRVHAMADRTLVPSAVAKNALAAQGFSHLAVWHRGADLGLFAPHRRDASLRAGLGAPARSLVGYLLAGDGDQRLDLLPSLAAVPDARLVTIGATSAEVRRRTPSAAHRGPLHLEDRATTIAALDLLVAPGSRATDCDSALSALAAGVPVVAADGTATAELVRHGRTGLVAPGSARAIAHATDLLVRDTDLRATLAAAARPSVIDRSWRETTRRLVEQLTAVAGAAAVVPVAKVDAIAA